MIPTPSDSDCILFLIRHGATPNNLADPPILQGRGLDGCLSETGIAQAQSAADALSELPIDACFSSPMKRAQETAEIIAKPHRLGLQMLDPITEVDVGDWEKGSWVHIQEEDRELYEKFIADPAVHGYKNGENLTDVYERVMPAFNDTLESHLGKTIVIVAHNVVNRVMLATALGLELKAAREISQDNCGINILKYSGGKLKVKTLNSTLHLP